MTMNAERIAELRQVSNGMATFIRTYGSFTLDSGDIVFLTDLLFILSDYEKVKVEAGKLRSWLDSANLRASVAEKGQELAEAKLVDLVASAEAQADSFAKMANEQEAELEKVKVELSHAKEVAEGAGYRLQKAEAALLGTQVVSAKNGAVIVEQMVELARYAPLIDAAKRAYEKRQGGYGLDMNEVQEALILCGYNAALACRMPEREKKEGSLTLENATEVAEKTARELNNSRVVTDDQLKKRVTI